MEDIEIIELYQKRSEEAIVQSDKKYGAYCFTVAYNILSDNEDSSECVNDTWLHTWNVIPPECPKKLKMFFAAITRNLSIDRLKNRSAQKRGNGELTVVLDELEECISDGKDVEEQYDAGLLTQVIENFLREISKRDRQIFVRRYFFTESAAIIAKRYGIKENAVYVSLHRTRQKLHKRLKKEGFNV